MKQNQNAVAVTLIIKLKRHTEQISRPFLTFPSIAEKNGRCREVIFAVRNTL